MYRSPSLIALTSFVLTGNLCAQLTDPFPTEFALGSIDGQNGFLLLESGPAVFANNRFGRSIATLGDVDGDGVSDFAAVSNTSLSSEVHVIFGGSDLVGDVIVNPATLPSSQEFVLTGEDVVRHVACVGDLNGDGLSDIGITASDVAYVVFGSPSLRTTGGSFDLTSITGSDGFTLTGLVSDNSTTPDISCAGDVNNDGTDDLIVGSPLSDSGGNDAGQVHVVFGDILIGASGSIATASLDGTNGFSINGLAVDDAIGEQVDGAEDVNGDGIADLIFGGRGDGSSSSQGRATYVVFGATGLGATGSFDLSEIDGTNGFVIGAGTPGDRGGTTARSIGDVNNDGLSDTLVGFPAWNSAEGRAMVVFGSTTIGTGDPIDPEDLDGSNGFLIEAEGLGLFGTVAAPLGDVNDDNIDDFIVSATLADFPGLNNAGACVVVFGRADLGSSGTVLASTLDGTNGFVISGRLAEDRSGASLAAGSDINEDGINDVFVGTPQAGGIDTGRVDVIFGRSPTAPCPADTNGDGLLNPADFNAWIFAFNAQGPACDQNGDGLCDPSDFNAWILNFNAGCP